MPIDSTDRNEVLAVIRELFTAGGARGREQAIRNIANALGYRRLGPRIVEVVSNDLKTAVRRGILDRSADEYSLLCRTIDQYTRDHLVAMLLAAMGNGWQKGAQIIRHRFIAKVWEMTWDVSPDRIRVPRFVRLVSLPDAPGAHRRAVPATV